ncbi:MAG: hypothetical protein ACT4PU_06130 [Planctomycetota bacterium]
MLKLVTADEGNVGLFGFTDVGFSDDGKQALVLAHTWRVNAPNPIVWVMLFNEERAKWRLEVMGPMILPIALPIEIKP